MKTSIAFGLAAIASLALVSSASADNTAGLVGNTVLLTTSNGGQIKVQLHSDGTYQTTTPQGTSKGTWKFDNGQLCYNQTDPAPAARSRTRTGLIVISLWIERDY